jgi:hypothetical protein
LGELPPWSTGEFEPRLLHGRPHRRRVNRVIAHDRDPAGVEVDGDRSDTGHFADFVFHRLDAVIAGHSGYGKGRFGHVPRVTIRGRAGLGVVPFTNTVHTGSHTYRWPWRVLLESDIRFVIEGSGK